MTDTADALARSPTLEALYPQLAAVGLGAGWAKPTPSLWPVPHKSFRPCHWRYAEARGALAAAGRLINTELAERRNLARDGAVLFRVTDEPVMQRLGFLRSENATAQ